MNTFVYDYFLFIEHLVRHNRRKDLFSLISSLCPPNTASDKINFVVDLLEKPIWFRVNLFNYVDVNRPVLGDSDHE